MRPQSFFFRPPTVFLPWTAFRWAMRFFAVDDVRGTLTYSKGEKRKPSAILPLADITKARTHLSWEPKIPLEVGIVKAAEYFRESLRASTRFAANATLDSAIRASAARRSSSLILSSRSARVARGLRVSSSE